MSSSLTVTDSSSISIKGSVVDVVEDKVEEIVSNTAGIEVEGSKASYIVVVVVVVDVVVEIVVEVVLVELLE